jgi:hypothetical protein
VRAELADAVERAIVQSSGAVRLALQTNADVFDGAGEDRVGDTGESARARVFGVGQVGRTARGLVALLEPPTGFVEGAELDGDAGADSNEGGQSALVKGEGAFVAVDGGGGVEGGRVLGRGLETDLDNIKGLAWESAVSRVYG